MKKSLEEAIVTACPKIYAHSKPRCADGRFECGDGWYGLILEISMLLEAEMDGPPLRPITVGIVKEKFGALRFGFSGKGPENLRAAIDSIEQRSRVTCELCGQPGILKARKGWLCVRCSSCEIVE